MISRERSMALASKLRAKRITDAERQELWEGHVPLAKSLAAGFGGSDQRTKIALQAISAALEEAPSQLRNDHFTAFCAAKIRSKLQQLDQGGEPVPLSSQPRAEAHGDKLLATCVSDTERQVVKLRLGGYTDREIAERLGLSAKAVRNARHEVIRRQLAPTR
jgi:DNA-binding NarL/FixJ family response regulator